jgi:hypothetical protein
MQLGRQFNVPIPEGTRIHKSGGIGHMPGDESHSVTKMLPVHTVMRYREWTDKQLDNSVDQKTIDNIADELRAGKPMREPLFLEHNTEHQWAVLGEGNHRLHAAARAGVSHVPVYVYSGSTPMQNYIRKGIGAPLTLTSSFGNFPGDRYQPKELHPDHFKELR